MVEAQNRIFFIARFSFLAQSADCAGSGAAEIPVYDGRQIIERLKEYFQPFPDIYLYLFYYR